jgi:hypothetical protein
VYANQLHYIQRNFHFLFRKPYFKLYRQHSTKYSYEAWIHLESRGRNTTNSLYCIISVMMFDPRFSGHLIKEGAPAQALLLFRRPYTVLPSLILLHPSASFSNFLSSIPGCLAWPNSRAAQFFLPRVLRPLGRSALPQLRVCQRLTNRCLSR